MFLLIIASSSWYYTIIYCISKLAVFEIKVIHTLNIVGGKIPLCLSVIYTWRLERASFTDENDRRFSSHWDIHNSFYRIASDFYKFVLSDWWQYIPDFYRLKRILGTAFTLLSHKKYFLKVAISVEVI